jgi:hypothetical protein
MRIRTTLPVLLLLVSATLTQAEDPKPTITSSKAVLVIGLGHINPNTKGTLELKDGALHFTSGRGSFDLNADTIQDVVTGTDSQRMIRGTLGTISQLGPYGSGRALSLLREKIDTLTIEYRDSEGALHGAVFTMAVGKADLLKQDLMSQGARTTIDGGHPSADSTSPSQAQEPLQ